MTRDLISEATPTEFHKIQVNYPLVSGGQATGEGLTAMFATSKERAR